MLRYLFTNDIRINTLNKKLKDTAIMVQTDSVPSAKDNKSLNNNINTLSFYFNLYKDNNNTFLAMNGDIKRVLINYMEKFQFPNPRTRESFENSKEDNIRLKPYQEIIRILYIGRFNHKDFYLTSEEIFNFVFLNPDVVNNRAKDYNKIIDQIMEYRNTKRIPNKINTKEGEGWVWKQQSRQINEMLGIMNWLDYVKYDNGKLEITNEALSVDTKGALFDILVSDKFLEPENLSFNDFKNKYIKYMEIPNESNTENIGFSLEESYKKYLIEVVRLSEGTVPIYLRVLKPKVLKIMSNYNPDIDIYQISDLNEFVRIKNMIKSSDNYAEMNEKTNNRAINTSLDHYEEFLKYISNQGRHPINKPHQRIFFGAPGTGKSFKLNEEAKEFGNNYERVTFHPDYSYANFVGTYKPIPITKGNIDGEELDSSSRSIDDENTEYSNGITYDFVPGPFMNVLVKAIESNEKDSNPKPYLLIIEEINRANTAAVFGDVFQLLDRKNGISEYGISPSKEIKKYLSNKLNKGLNEINDIRIPDNMFIWATMNSADQGVFPMDTAFKRRWDFEYIGINDNEDKIKDYTVELGTEVINWNDLRKSINQWLVSHGVNEDKLLGPFFIDYKSILIEDKDRNILDSEKFRSVFKNKVLMYLYEDAARHKKDIFGNGDNILLSEVFKAFDEEGVRVFNNEIVNDLISTAFIDDSNKSSMIYETPGKEETINEMREAAEEYGPIDIYDTEDNI